MEQCLPQVPADDAAVVAAGHTFVGEEVAAKRRLNAEKVQEVGFGGDSTDVEGVLADAGGNTDGGLIDD